MDYIFLSKYASVPLSVYAFQSPPHLSSDHLIPEDSEIVASLNWWAFKDIVQQKNYTTKYHFSTSFKKPDAENAIPLDFESGPY